jgi:hypothetical protein
MTSPTPFPLRALSFCVVVYIALALIAAGIAIRENLPAEFGGSSTGLTVTQDFLYGMGTAISPPFYTLLIQLAMLLLAARKDRWGTVGVLGLTIVGLLTCTGALSEPINLRIFNPATFDLLKAGIMAGLILLSIAIMIFGMLEWLRRRREYQSKEMSYET